MKYKNFLQRLWALLVMGILGTVLTLSLLVGGRPKKAWAQVTPATITLATNVPAVVTAGTTSNMVSFITLHQGRGVGLGWVFNGATNASMVIYSSVDGSNVSTLPWCTLLSTNLLTAVSGTGTNVTVVTNWGSQQLAGLAALVISNFTSTGTKPLANTGVFVNLPVL